MAGIDGRKRRLLMAAALGSAALGAHAMTPRRLARADTDLPDLEALVPTRFADWRPDTGMAPVQPSPDVQQRLARLYSQTLARTYVDDQGSRIMLSIAYGEDQSRALQIHKPDVCYVSQGFQVSQLHRASIALREGSIAVARMVATRDARIEPVSYWIRTGEVLVTGWFEQNVARLRYGLRGVIPDGLLFRVSNLSSDPAAAYRVQDRFVAAMLEATRGTARRTLIGKT